MAFACMLIDGVAPHQELDRRTRRHPNNRGPQMTFGVDWRFSRKRSCRPVRRLFTSFLWISLGQPDRLRRRAV